MMSTVAALAVVAGALVVAPAAYAGVDDYPAKWRSIPRDSTFDSWGEYNRECTSWVAWRLHGRNGFEMPFHADADQWGVKAKKLGYIVDRTPAVGAVAWWSWRHVAWVEAVNPDGSITIEEYNHGSTGKYDERTIPASWPTGGYIHFKDIATDFSDGKYISYAGRVYRMAGGAPIFVSNWADFGGKKVSAAATPAQWHSLRLVPADGTFLTAKPSGTIYRVVGGAPVMVSSWAAVGGSQPSVTVSDQDIAQAGPASSSSPYKHLRYFPADGSLVTTGSGADAQLYRITGGAADLVPAPPASGAQQPGVAIDPAALLAAGTALSGPASHLKGVLAGAKPTTAGQRLVRYVLTAHAGRWPTGSKVTFQWTRNGVPITQAHASRYRLRPADLRAHVSVIVTVAKPGFRSTTLTSSQTVAIRKL